MTQKHIGILNCSAPFSKPNAKDALDVALIMGSYEQSIALFFQGDGVWQLINNQSPQQVNAKAFLDTFSAFKFYDIEHIYVCEASLKERNLTDNFHIGNYCLLDQDEFSDKLHQLDVVYKF